MIPTTPPGTKQASMSDVETAQIFPFGATLMA